MLISRAKRRCEVYASITDEDIDLERGKGKGVFAFKLFLHYARTGCLSMNERTGRQMGEPSRRTIPPTAGGQAAATQPGKQPAITQTSDLSGAFRLRGQMLTLLISLEISALSTPWRVCSLCSIIAARAFSLSRKRRTPTICR